MDKNSKSKFWKLKPYWCQPWSIITVGILLLIFSWTSFNNLIITSILGFIIIIWWIVFLIIAPISYEDMSDKNT
tara:strand:+ start:131 stop:352 length:222 start_codon:yes stop_codon:yes gene_type:complete